MNIRSSSKKSGPSEADPTAAAKGCEEGDHHDRNRGSIRNSRGEPAFSKPDPGRFWSGELADDDTLDVWLNFGGDAQTGRPAAGVGPIHVVYHWGDPGHVPKVGYETFRRRDLPPEPCP
jgi:hypothetical protein